MIVAVVADVEEAMEVMEGGVRSGPAVEYPKAPISRTLERVAPPYSDVGVRSMPSELEAIAAGKALAAAMAADPSWRR